MRFASKHIVAVIQAKRGNRLVSHGWVHVKTSGVNTNEHFNSPHKKHIFHGTYMHTSFKSKCKIFTCIKLFKNIYLLVKISSATNQKMYLKLFTETAADKMATGRLRKCACAHLLFLHKLLCINALALFRSKILQKSNFCCIKLMQKYPTLRIIMFQSKLGINMV